MTNQETKTAAGQAPTILAHFNPLHLPPELQTISTKFLQLAVELANRLPPGPELDQCLRRLLEAKDCAVRAEASPGL